MKKLLLVLCIGSVSLRAYDLTPRTDFVSTTTYQPYQPTIARQPITHAERTRMTYQNDMLRLQAVQNQLLVLYDKLSDLKKALITDPGHTKEIQKTIGMVNNTIDEYETQVEQYKRNLGIE